MIEKIIIDLPKRFFTNRTNGESFEMEIWVAEELNADQKKIIAEGVETRIDTLVEDNGKHKWMFEGTKLVWQSYVEKLKNSDWIRLIEGLATKLYLTEVDVDIDPI